MKKLLTIFFLLQFIFGYTQCIEGDCENGTGTFKWENGDIYEGEFKDGELNGQGKTTKDGNIIEGKFSFGVPYVIHKITFKDGVFFEGKFKIKSLNF